MKSLGFQEADLRSILGSIGIMDVDVLRGEGVAMGEDALKRSTDATSKQLNLVQEFLM